MQYSRCVTLVYLAYFISCLFCVFSVSFRCCYLYFSLKYAHIVIFFFVILNSAMKQMGAGIVLRQKVSRVRRGATSRHHQDYLSVSNLAIHASSYEIQRGYNYSCLHVHVSRLKNHIRSSPKDRPTKHRSHSRLIQPQQ